MKKWIYGMLTLFFCEATLAQADAQQHVVRDSQYILPIDSITMTAGPKFAATTSKQFWWGKHWRSEWLEPVNFPVFNMDTIAGGLTPIKMGGGHETKTLRLLGKNGKEYVLRTVDKSLDALIPADLKGSFLDDIANDQISTAHPYGPLVIAKLSEAIGVLHTNPRFVYVSYTPSLAEFNEVFAYKLCLFEERPSGTGWENSDLTGFANEVVNSEKLFSRLNADNTRRVDQQEFLKVRLFDMFVNDWDRHDDQWVWAAREEGRETIYRPFARDRDQAFSRTEGVNMYLLSRPWALRSLQNLDPHIHDVIGANMAATSLDKLFLNALTAGDWKEAIKVLQQQLPDSVLALAIQTMPGSIQALSGDFLFQRLKARRDDMARFGMRYYEILNREVFIVGTKHKELFTIFKVDKHTTEVIGRRITGKGQPKDTIYHRLFNDRVTRNINIFGMDDVDQFVFGGNKRNRIGIRIMGGEGQDIYSAITSRKGQGKKSKVYDAPADKGFVSNAFRFRSTTDTLLTDHRRNGFHYDWWLPLVIPGYNPDDGFVIGAGLLYRKRQWNKDPYAWQQTIGFNYAAATRAYNLYYKGILKQAFGKWDLEFAANYNSPAYVVNFYGFGNESALVTRNKNYYRVRATGILVQPALSRTWKKNYFKAGVNVSTVKIKREEDKFISHGMLAVDSSVFTTKLFSSIHMSYQYNTANNAKYPTKGIFFRAGANYLINLKEQNKDFIKIQSDFTFYLTPWKGITIAHRTGASTNLGDYEFYQANTIGGSDNLRGFWRTRFTGHAAFYQNTDIRVKIADIKGYFIRGNFGVYGFFDDGRVWARQDSSTILHYGYGGGIYFIPYSTLAINLAFASSKEVNVFAFRTGFLF